MSTGPQLLPSATPQERNWLPIGIAIGAVLLVVIGWVAVFGNGKPPVRMTAINAPLDPYAASLPISNLVMSESANLAGGKVTYVDGHIANKGSQTVTGITVQVLFRNAANEVAQNETQPLKLIRTRQPYVDLQPVSDAPLKPGGERDFRLIFDPVNQDWNGAYPEIRILKVKN